MHNHLKTLVAFAAGALLMLACQRHPVEKQASAQSAAPSRPAPTDDALPPNATSQSHIEVINSDAVPIYSNFVRVTGTPDEAILDFGLITGFGKDVPPVHVHAQVVLNYYTLKRMANAIDLSLSRQEAAFGPLELDVNKRVRQQ